MQLEGDPRQYPRMEGVDAYLHEAALADNPPSGTFYDPDHEGDVNRLGSLGVHEHWNDPVNRQYSRNLGSGDGIELITRSSVTQVPAVVAGFASYCFPNPFNPRTAIRFELPEPGRAELTVFNASGARVVTLLNADLAAGEHEIVWHGRDDSGRECPSGTYYYLVTQGEIRESGKMALVR
jgi:hypothetical protein